MDDRIRNLQREAAAGGAIEKARLEHALVRLGRDALAYTGPQAPRPKPHQVPRQLDRAEASAAGCYDWGRAPQTRREAASRAFSKRRRRRAMRRTRKVASRDWDLWE